MEHILYKKKALQV